MNHENAPREINGKHVFIFMLRRWRLMVALGIILALVLGAYQAVNGLKNRENDFKSYYKAVDEYNASLKEYETRKEMLELEIQKKVKTSEAQLLYLEESILMNMNPDKKTQVSADILITLDKLVLDRYSHEAYDPADSLISLYSGRIVSEADLSEFTADGINEKYIRELISVKLEASNNIIAVTVSHPDEAVAVSILDEILNTADTCKASIEKQTFAHSLTVIKGKPEQVYDAALKESQEKANALLSSYNTSLTSSQSDLKKLAKPSGVTVSEPSFTNIVIKSCIFAVLGFILGAGIIAVMRAIAYFCGAKIRSEAELAELNTVRVLGNTVIPGKTRFLPCVDRLIDSFEGIDTDISHEQKQEILAFNIREAIGSAKSLLLIGGAEQIDFELLKQHLKTALPDVEISIQRDIHKNVSAYCKLNQNDAVILVEKINATKYRDLNKIKSFVEAKGKALAGCILV